MIQIHEFPGRFYAQLFVATKGVVKLYRYEEPCVASEALRAIQKQHALKRAIFSICGQAEADGLCVSDVTGAEHYAELLAEKRRA